MSSPLRIYSSLPADTQYNGLAGHAWRFLGKEPADVWAVMQLGTKSATRDVEMGGETAVARIRAVEIGLTPAYADELQDLMERIRRHRLPKATLPFGDEADL
ncbi:hypothetical protein [Parafrankia sp. FMc2]|uniref:hypothetical protein n=1 Tax=Parafrankia sp. FMc2 TaxID=3233196 RepID=UPI0034D5994C